MDNEQCQTRVQEKKKLKTRKEAKRGRGRESKPTLIYQNLRRKKALFALCNN